MIRFNEWLKERELQEGAFGDWARKVGAGAALALTPFSATAAEKDVPSIVRHDTKPKLPLGAVANKKTGGGYTLNGKWYPDRERLAKDIRDMKQDLHPNPDPDMLNQADRQSKRALPPVRKPKSAINKDALDTFGDFLHPSPDPDILNQADRQLK